MKTLSIKCGLAYLVCAGIKDVENRTWKTDYRGTLLIHSSGDESDNNLRLSGTKLFSVLDNIPKMKKSEYFAENGDGTFDIIVKPEIEKEVELFELVSGKKPKLKLSTQAIIGEVELIDIIQDSQSPFAIVGQNHWIFSNAKLYEKPIIQIAGRLGLWDYKGSI